MLRGLLICSGLIDGVDEFSARRVRGRDPHLRSDLELELWRSRSARRGGQPHDPRPRLSLEVVLEIPSPWLVREGFLGHQGKIGRKLPKFFKEFGWRYKLHSLVFFTKAIRFFIFGNARNFAENNAYGHILTKVWSF